MSAEEQPEDFVAYTVTHNGEDVVMLCTTTGTVVRVTMSSYLRLRALFPGRYLEEPSADES
jgi:hypothetical protein